MSFSGVKAQAVFLGEESRIGNALRALVLVEPIDVLPTGSTLARAPEISAETAPWRL